MIDKNNLPDNTLLILMSILENGDLKVVSGQKFSSDLAADEAYYYSDLLAGLNFVLSSSPDMLVEIGSLTRLADEVEGGLVVFEADDELLEAVSNANVISLKDRMH